MSWKAPNEYSPFTPGRGPDAGKRRMIGIAAGIAAVRAQEQSAHFLADASEFHANENAHLERAFGAKRVAAVETDRVVVEPRRALADRVRGRFRTDQIGRPHHLRRRGDNRSGRHGVEMRPIQFDVVGCVGNITTPKAGLKPGLSDWLLQLGDVIGSGLISVPYSRSPALGCRYSSDPLTSKQCGGLAVVTSAA
ncbi:MAG: hypothetical protein WBD83_19490 [Xanthobacteraceae bacterium]